MKPEFPQASGGGLAQVAGSDDALRTESHSPERGDDLAAGNLSEARVRSEDNSAARVKPAHRPGSSKNKKVLVLCAIAAVVFIVLSLLGYYFVGRGPNQGAASVASVAPPAVTVSTAAAKLEPVDDVLSVTGSISAWDPLNIGSEVSGLRITEVDVEEGDTVRKGQVLAVSNSAMLQAQLSEAKARLVSGQAALVKAVQPNRPEEIKQLNAALAEAEANVRQEVVLQHEAKVNLANAELNESRFAQLASMAAVSAQESEARRLTADTAREEVRSHQAKIEAARSAADEAKQKLVEAQRGGRLEDVAMSKAMIAQTRAQIQELTVQISQTVIRAPDDGVIGKRDAHIGEITSIGSPLFSIIRLNRLELQAQVPDFDLARFKVGQLVSISSREDEPGRAIGTVWLVSPEVDPVSRLGTVRVNLAQNSGLKPGMFVRGVVKLGRRTAVTVPVAALQTRNGESFVFTIDGDRAISCPVKVGVQTDRLVEIVDGLKPDQVVIAKGSRFLSDRDVVRVSR